MPLTETSSLEDSLARILGQPATPAAATPVAPAASLMAYSPMSGAGSTSIDLGAEQPVTAEPVTATTPAAPTTVPAAEAAAAPAAAASLMPDYKSYHEYYADNPEALEKAGYLGTAGQPLSTTTGVGGEWTNGNPYQYRNEYNQYLSTMPTEYQALGKSNITGAAVKSGAITGVYDPVTKQTYSVGPDVAPGTVKAGSVATPTASALTKPVNPGPKAPWQKSAQYWKDLAAYNATGAK